MKNELLVKRLSGHASDFLLPTNGYASWCVYASVIHVYNSNEKGLHHENSVMISNILLIIFLFKAWILPIRIQFSEKKSSVISIHVMIRLCFLIFRDYTKEEVTTILKSLTFFKTPCNCFLIDLCAGYLLFWCVSSRSYTKTHPFYNTCVCCTHERTYTLLHFKKLTQILIPTCIRENTEFCCVIFLLTLS